MRRCGLAFTPRSLGSQENFHPNLGQAGLQNLAEDNKKSANVSPSSVPCKGGGVGRTRPCGQGTARISSRNGSRSGSFPKRPLRPCESLATWAVLCLRKKVDRVGLRVPARASLAFQLLEQCDRSLHGRGKSGGGRCALRCPLGRGLCFTECAEAVADEHQPDYSFLRLRG